MIATRPLERLARCRAGSAPWTVKSGPVMPLEERSYAVVLEPDADGGFTAHIPAFRGAHTQGETVEEALANARDVIAGYIEVMMAHGEPIPPSDLAATVAVSVPPSAA
jgi:predicted RNase H-like HicB family nuclease